MRLFLFALFVASCYANPPMLGKKFPPAVVTKKVVLPQKTVTVQRDVPVKSPPKLVTVTRPVPSIPNIVTIDKKVPVASPPKIVTVHKQISIPTQVVVPRPIPSPPRIITIEKPVPVPQTVIVDKPYLVPTPVIIPRPVPVYVTKSAKLGPRAPISLQPIIASGPLPRPLPTPLANAQSMITGRTTKATVNWGKLLADQKLLEANLLAAGKKGVWNLDAPLLLPGKLNPLPAKLGGSKLALASPLVLPGSLKSILPPLKLEEQLLLNSDLALGKRPILAPELLPAVPKVKLLAKQPLTKWDQLPKTLNPAIQIPGSLGILGAPLTLEQQLAWKSNLGLPKASLLGALPLKA